MMTWLDYSVYSVLPKRCDIQATLGPELSLKRIVFEEKQEIFNQIIFEACAELIVGWRLPEPEATQAQPDQLPVLSNNAWTLRLLRRRQPGQESRGVRVQASVSVSLLYNEHPVQLYKR